MSTLIFAARKALSDALTAAVEGDPELAGVSVHFADQLRDSTEQITILGYGPVDETTPMLSGREETFTLRVMVSVFDLDGTPEGVETRTEKIVNLVLRTIHSQSGDDTLSGTVADARIHSFATDGTFLLEQGGYGCVVDIDVRC